MDLGIKDKKALILASSDGLGKAIATELQAEEAQTILSSRGGKKLKDAAKEVGALGSYELDLYKPGSAKKLVQDVINAHGDIDILVANAGGPPAGGFEDLSIEQWQSNFQSLFLSVVECCQAVLPKMKQNEWGRIIVVTSVAGKEPVANLAISNALRAGLHGFVNSLSKEVAPFGVTVNALLPSYTDTNRLRELKRNTAELTRKIPAGRLGRADEFGKLAAYLCSNHTGFITGQAIGFDGGSLQSI